MDPLFEDSRIEVGKVLGQIEDKIIALPDLQRPFVWPNQKVCKLLDSMFRGFPIGYIMLWEAPDSYNRSVSLGRVTTEESHARMLIVDGQQRLTGLIAAMTGVPVKDVSYQPRNINIAFNPIRREFAVLTSAIERSPEWIKSISNVFLAEQKEHNFEEFQDSYLAGLEQSLSNKNSALSKEKRNEIKACLRELLKLWNYKIPFLKIYSSADEEGVAEIFVRVNSGGQTLTEKNFIETLLSVYDNGSRQAINEFCEQSRIPVFGSVGTSFNTLIQLSSVHVIRVAVGLAFYRAKLRYAYLLLRGKDLKTERFTEEVRDVNLEKFRSALAKVMNLENWHAFLNHVVAAAGYVSEAMLVSENALMFDYMFYLIGKYEFKVKDAELCPLMRRWVYVSMISGFYSRSIETTIESVFNDLGLSGGKSARDPGVFIGFFNRKMEMIFTDDYFEKLLPESMKTSSVRSPVWCGFLAAQNVLGSKLLFGVGEQTVRDLLVPSASGKKKALDVHHIFPKAFLKSCGFERDRDRNQIANFAYLSYQTNIAISDADPREYVGSWRKTVGETAYLANCEHTALPQDFELMKYPVFLDERRKVMAQLVKRGYDKLMKQSGF